MQILQLRLINVKSYVDETLDFQPGINFISGINGAGKSTIIESIGYALFNYNPYLLKQLLREGASQGEIQVLIEGADERLYRVIRKFNATSSQKWEVWDEETSAMLDELHGSDDVSLWLKRTMGVAPGDSLPDLFRQVIAVQQGQFTTPFLDAPGPRTKTFDAVLKVEDYREAFTNTAFLEKELDHEAQALTREREILELTLAELPGVTADLEETQEQYNTKQDTFHQLERELQANLAVLEVQQKQKESLEQLDKELSMLRLQIENSGQQLHELEKDHAEAEQAQLVVEAHRAGFERYEILQRELQVVEERLEQKRLLTEKISQLELNLATTAAKLEADQARWTEDKANLDQALTTTTKQLQEHEEIAENLRIVEADMASFNNLAYKWQPLLKEREDWIKEHRHVLDEARTHRQRLSDLQLSISEVAVALEELPQLQEKLAQLEAEDQLETLRHRQVEKRGELEALLRNEDHLTKGVCPIIQEVCPSERVAHGLDEFFREQKDKLESELTRLAAEIELALQVQAERDGLRDRVRDAQNQQVFMAQQQDSFEQILQTSFEALAKLPWFELQRINDHIRELGDFYQAQQTLLGRKLPLWGLATVLELPAVPSLLDPVPLLPREYSAQTLDSWLNTWASWEAQLNSVYDTWQNYGQAWLLYINNLQTQITTKVTVAHDAEQRSRKELEKLRNEHAKLAQESEGFSKQQGEVTELALEVSRLKEEMLSLGEPEEVQKELKGQLTHYQVSYQLYQTNLHGAQKLPPLTARLTALQASYGTLQEQLAEKQVEQSNLLIEYSRESHVALDALVQEQKTAHLELRRDLEELRRREEELRIRLASLQEKEDLWRQKGEELAHATATLDFTKLFRQVLREAADPIAQQYRNSLSMAATQIYRQVSSENVSIEWGSQYELQLVDYDQGKERTRVFRQLSGGEQMTAALAIRLALMQLLSPMNLGFFDEPTTNLDRERRESLALAIQNATADFEQLFLISHDDSFDTVTENVISLRKDQGAGTQVDSPENCDIMDR